VSSVGAQARPDRTEARPDAPRRRAGLPAGGRPPLSAAAGVVALAVAGAVLGVLGGLVGLRFQPPVYVATASILLYLDDPAEGLLQDFVQQPNAPERFVATQVDVARSRAVLEQAAERVGLDRAEALAEAVSISPGSTTDTLSVTGRAVRPDLAAAYADAVAESYVENRRAAAVQGIDDAVAAIAARLQELEAQAASSTSPLARQAAEAEYQRLFGLRENLVVRAELQQGLAEIIAQAVPPAAPASPRPVRTVAVALVLGTLLGAGAGLLRHQLDDRVRTAETVSRLTGLPAPGPLVVPRRALSSPRGAAVDDHALRLAARVEQVSGAPVRMVLVAPVGAGEEAAGELVAHVLGAALRLQGRDALVQQGADLVVPGHAPALRGRDDGRVSVVAGAPLLLSATAAATARGAGAVCLVALAGHTRIDDLRDASAALAALAPGRSVAVLVHARRRRLGRS